MNEEIIIHDENILSENEEKDNESVSDDEKQIIEQSNDINVKILHISPFIFNGRIVQFLDKTSNVDNKPKQTLRCEGSSRSRYNVGRDSVSCPSQRQKSIMDFESNIINSVLKKKKF